MLSKTLLSCFIAFVIAGHDIHFHRYRRYIRDGISNDMDSESTHGKYEEPVPDVKLDGCAGFSGKKVYIIADDGKLLSRCYGCGQETGDTVTVHGKKGEQFAMWTLQLEGDKCTLLSDVKKYAGRCYGCWKESTHKDAIFNHINYGEVHKHPWAQWKIEKQGSLYSFQADTGNYMSRCEGCVPGLVVKSAAMVDATTPSGRALWRIEVV